MTIILVLLYIAAVYVLLYIVFGLKPSTGIASCGLYGFSGAKPVDVAKLRWLANLNQVRGSDSTGIFTIKNNKTSEKTLYKSIKKAEDFILEEDAINALTGAFSVIGHTRASTKGIVNYNNAHPFKFNLGTEVVGAHNGFVPDEFMDEYVEKYKLKDAFRGGLPDVDSQIIFAALSKTGSLDTLSELEGAVITLHMEPEKHGRTIFVYKRVARDLHYGITKEGIYISSLEAHLKTIGCTRTATFIDNTLTVITDGEIVDVKPMTEPKIKVYWNQQRGSFNVNNTQRSYEDYYNGHSQSCSVPYRNNNLPSKVNKVDKDDDTDDVLRMITKDVIEEVSLLSPSSYKLTKPISEYECAIDNMNDCVVLVQLLADVKGKPLPAWSVFDNEDEEFASITGLNGVAMIKYPLLECGKKRTLKMIDPVDGQLVHLLDIEPKIGTVQEVTVQIPFQEESDDEGNSEDSTRKRKDNSSLLRLGRLLEFGILSVVPKVRGLLSPGASIQRTLSEQEESVHIGSEKTKDAGANGSGQSKPGSTNFSESISSERNRPYTGNELYLIKKLIEALCAWAIGSSSWKKSTELDHYKGTKEYNRLFKIWNYYIGVYIDLGELMRDAGRIKHYEAMQNNSSKSLGFYMTLLLDYCITPEGNRLEILGTKIVNEITPMQLPVSYLSIKAFGVKNYNDKIKYIKKFLNGFEVGAVLSVPDDSSRYELDDAEDDDDRIRAWETNNYN